MKNQPAKGTLKSAHKTAQKTDNIPAGYLTAAQWARIEQVSIGRAHQILRDLKDAEAVHIKRFRILLGDGTVRPVAHYRLK